MKINYHKIDQGIQKAHRLLIVAEHFHELSLDAETHQDLDVFMKRKIHAETELVAAVIKLNGEIK